MLSFSLAAYLINTFARLQHIKINIETRENEVRERIPVPHDNYFQSFFSSRHAARVISEFCSHDRAIWFHVGHQGISYHSLLCPLRGRGM